MMYRFGEASALAGYSSWISVAGEEQCHKSAGKSDRIAALIYRDAA